MYLSGTRGDTQREITDPAHRRAVYKLFLAYPPPHVRSMKYLAAPEKGFDALQCRIEDGCAEEERE